MKLRKLICLGLVCLLLTACGGTVRQEDLTGCWLMGQDREYRYLSRFGSDGSMEILFVPRGDWTEVFTIGGSYSLQEGTLNRTYSRETPENSVLNLPARLEIRGGALILDYGELTECWAKLTPEAEALCHDPEGGAECPDCAGLGIRGIREELPLFCETCCGLGIVAE